MNKKNLIGGLIVLVIIIVALVLLIKPKSTSEVMPDYDLTPTSSIENNNETFATSTDIAEIETPVIVEATTTTTTLANPASVNCATVGGTLEMQTKEDGSQYALCFFDDNRACEEWAMFNGDCPVGGVKTTGYDTTAQKYCAWLGGRTIAKPDAVCTFSDKSTCLAADLYLDACKKGEWAQK